MTLRSGIFGMLALCLTASSVLADEVLYCTDTAVTGFQWGKNGATSPRQGLFNEERFTIKVLTETRRIITRMIGGTTGKTLPITYECHGLGFEPPPDGPITCIDSFLGAAEPWMFYKSNYTRAFLAGPRVMLDGDPNIMIAYGTCTKF